MSNQFQNKKIIPRYKIVAYVMVIVGLVILIKATYIATAQHSYWMAVAARLKKDSVDVKR